MRHECFLPRSGPLGEGPPGRPNVERGAEIELIKSLVANIPTRPELPRSIENS
jgi:hypothetical protein